MNTGSEAHNLGKIAVCRPRNLKLLSSCRCRPPRVLDVQFRRTARFPGVLYLDPEPADGLRQLTLAIAERWPEAPPYGGGFDEVVPHLTLAQGATDGVMDDIETEVLRGLPVRTRLVEACLYVFDGGRWRLRARLPFDGRRSDGDSG